MPTTQSRAKKLTMRQCAALFGVVPFTIYGYRKGSTRREPLPVVHSEGRNVYVLASEATAWAKRYGIPLACSVSEAMEREPELAKGPKVLAKPEPAKKASKSASNRTKS